MAWWLRGRLGEAGSGPSRRHTIKVAAVSSVITLGVAGAAAYGVIKWKFGHRPVQKASVDDALRDFRSASAKPVATDDSSRAEPSQAKTTAPVAANTPSGGVYTYKARGFFQVDAPVVGRHRRDLAATVPAMVVRGDSPTCWELKIWYFKQHTWRARYCRDRNDAQRMEFVKTANQFFGRKIGGKYGCVPADIVRVNMKPGDQFMTSCGSIEEPRKPDAAKTDVSITFVGDEDVDVGGELVSSRHLVRKVHVVGRQSGSTIRHLWFSKKTGLLVRVREKGRSSGLAKFEADWELILTSTTPRK